MASQDTDMVDEVDEAKLAPLGAGESATGDPSELSPGANVESREVLETHQDPAVSPDLATSQDPTTSPDPALSQDPVMSPDLTMNQDPVASRNTAMSQDPAMCPVPAESPHLAVSPYQVTSQDPAASQDPAMSPYPATSQDLTTSPEQSLNQDPAMSSDLVMSQDPAASLYQAASQDLAASPIPATSPYPGMSPIPVASPLTAASPVPSGCQDTATSSVAATNSDPTMSADPVMSPNLAASQETAVSQDPGPHENPQPQNPNGGPANVKGSSPLLRLPFPRRLWMIVEDDAFSSVSWNDAGDTMVIKEELFQREVLCRRGADQIFETNSLKTFICLLNFHGFSKIRPRDPSVYHSENNRIMIFRNANFQRDKPQLIDNIKRKGHLMITAWPQTSSTPKKKKQAAAPTRRSLRIQLKQRSKEGDTRAQKTDPNVQGSRDTRSFMLPSYVSFDNMTRRAREEPFPREPVGPSGEGTSGNVRLAPTATAAREGAGEEPTGPPDFNSVLSLYNTCYSIPMAALSATAPPNAPEGEEEEEQVEEENSSDYKCALCEHLKRKQVSKLPRRW